MLTDALAGLATATGAPTKEEGLMRKGRSYLVIVIAFLGACGKGDTPTAVSSPSPVPVVAATPTPAPGTSVDSLIANRNGVGGWTPGMRVSVTVGPDGS